MNLPLDPIEASIERTTCLVKEIVARTRARWNEAFDTTMAALGSRGEEGLAESLADARSQLMSVDIRRLVTATRGATIADEGGRKTPPRAVVAPPAPQRLVRRGRTEMPARKFDPVDFLRTTQGLEVLDERATTDVVWVIGNGTLAPVMQSLRRDRGYAFTYRAEGSDATGFRSAWRAYLPEGSE